MASRTKEIALAVLIKAKDEASSIFSGVIGKTAALLTALNAFLGVKFFGSAIAEAGDFEKAMARVIAKSDDGAAHAGELKKAAEDIGQAYNVGASEAAQGLEILSAAGLKSAEAIKILPTVLALARAEDINLDAATELVVGAVTGMGQAFTSAAHDADVMVAASKASTGSATDMGMSMKYAAANARALGLDVDQLGALTAVLANNNIKGEQAGTGLRQTFAQMLDPTSNLRKALAGLGDTSGDFNKALQMLAAAGPRGEAAISGLDVEVGTIVRNLLNAGIPTIQSLTTQFSTLTGTAQDTAKTMQENLPSALGGLGVAWESLKRYLVEPLLGPIRQQVLDLTQGFRDAVTNGSIDSFRTSLVEAFNKAASSVKEFIAGVDLAQVLQNVQDFAASTVDAFKTVGDIGGKAAAAIQVAWNGVVTAVDTVGVAIGKLNEWMNAGAAAVAGRLEKVGLSAAGTSEKLRQEAEGWQKSTEAWTAAGIKAYDATTAALAKFGVEATAASESHKKLADNANKAAGELTIEIAAAKDAAPAIDGLKTALEDATPKQTAAANEAKILADELKRLKQVYEDLKASGTATPQELEDALKTYMGVMNATTAAAQNMSKAVVAAYTDLGIKSSDTLKNLADQAVISFETIKNSGAAVGDINAAFAVMAERVLQAGEALGPMGEQIAIWKLKAMTATEEQQQALDLLIQKYQDSGQASVTASNQQVVAANTAAVAIENYSARVEARAGAGAKAFQETTQAIQQQTAAVNKTDTAQERAIQGYDQLTEAGKRMSDAMLRESIAADARVAGTMLYRDETGKTIREIQDMIAAEKSAAEQIAALNLQYDQGKLKAGQYNVELAQLALQLQNPITSAGQSARDELLKLEQALGVVSQGYRDTASASQASYTAQVQAATDAAAAIRRIQPTLSTSPSLEIDKGGGGGASQPQLPYQPSQSQNAPPASRTVRVVFALPTGDVPISTDEVSAQRLVRALESAKLRAS